VDPCRRRKWISPKAPPKALAQADWVKGLATAKALPRNGYAVAAPPPAYRVLDEPESDDDDDDDDDSGPTMPPMPPWVEAITALTPVLKTCGELGGDWLKRKFSASTPTGPEVSRNAAPEAATGDTGLATEPPNPMIHLSEINARLTGFERKFLNVVIRGKQGAELTDMLIAMSVDEAVAFVKENIAHAQAARHVAPERGGAPPVDAPSVDVPPVGAAPVDAPPVDALPAKTKPAPAASGGSPDFMSYVLSGSAYLTAEERATVMWLVPRFPAARLEELKAKLLQMTPRDGAMWIRENLATLRAEVSA
jgi:hypothetical protein